MGGTGVATPPTWWSPGFAPAARCSRRTTVASALRKTPFWAISLPIATSQGEEGTDEIHADRRGVRHAHPYTRTLLGAVPLPNSHGERPEWKVREPLPDPSGCRFRAPCAVSLALTAHGCGKRAEEGFGLRHLTPDHAVACHCPEQGEF
ncbi:hypothetical protein GCM10023191_028180 [Actinoallomurus oryzae]|uniref:Oligopeptide/dipeptide ABC transporter C-terminal domain-containing protein n=1 Tax=Actinoallomurus oryzae TaxID=502180 RepID=A0ABP8PW50_9ACTN